MGRVSDARGRYQNSGKGNMDYKSPSRLRHDQYAGGGKGGQYGRNRSLLQSWTGLNFSTGAGKPEGFCGALNVGVRNASK